jgi:hypothetical protein
MEISWGDNPSDPGGCEVFPANSVKKEEFVPEPNLTEVERREFEVILELAGFTSVIKRAVIKSPTAAKAMFHAAIAELGITPE